MPGKLGYGLKKGFSALSNKQKYGLYAAGGAATLVAGGAALNQITGSKHNPVGSAVGMGVIAGGAVMAPKLLGKGLKRLGAGKKMSQSMKDIRRMSRDAARAQDPKALRSLGMMMDNAAKKDPMTKTFLESLRKNVKPGMSMDDLLNTTRNAQRDGMGVDMGLRNLGSYIQGMGGSMGEAAKIGAMAGAATAAIGGTMRVADRRQGY